MKDRMVAAIAKNRRVVVRSIELYLHVLLQLTLFSVPGTDTYSSITRRYVNYSPHGCLPHAIALSSISGSGFDMVTATADHSPPLIVPLLDVEKSYQR